MSRYSPPSDRKRRITTVELKSLRKITIIMAFVLSMCCASGCTQGKKHEATLSLSLDSLSWNITKEERATILKSPETIAQASYWPNHAIPGINAHWSQCSILMLPCVNADEETMAIPVSHVDTVKGKLEFTIPLLSAARHFPLQNIEIILPFYSWPNGTRSYESDARISLRLTRDEKEGHRILPVWFASPHRALAGILLFTTTDDLYLTTNWPSQLVSDSWDPPYTFYYPYSRFAGYSTGDMSFPIKKTLQAPYPPELAGLKEIYHAWFDSGVIDGHHIERVDIAGRKDKPDSCFFNETSYQALLVDAKVIHYSEDVPDPSESHCTQRRREIDFNDDGQVVSYSDYPVLMTDNGSQVDYSAWNSLCKSDLRQYKSKCTHAAPTTQEISELVEAAKHVSGWFGTAPANNVSSSL